MRIILACTQMKKKATVWKLNRGENIIQHYQDLSVVHIANICFPFFFFFWMKH